MSLNCWSCLIGKHSRAEAGQRQRTTKWRRRVSQVGFLAVSAPYGISPHWSLALCVQEYECSKKLERDGGDVSIVALTTAVDDGCEWRVWIGD